MTGIESWSEMIGLTPVRDALAPVNGCAVGPGCGVAFASASSGLSSAVLKLMTSWLLGVVDRCGSTNVVEVACE
jgi:hypothetical protein